VLSALNVPGAPWPAVPSYAVLLALAVGLSLLLARRALRAAVGVDAGAAWRALLVLGVATLAGGRLHLVASYWSHFAAHPATALRAWAGLHAGGAVAALALCAPVVTRWYRLSPGRFADAIVPACGVGIAVARLGCFLHGCCFGATCALPWCLAFPPGSEAHAHHVALGLIAADAGGSAPVHPLQLYFAAAGVGIAVLGTWLQGRKRYDGQVALVALVVFAATSTALEPLRADLPTRVYWGPVPQLLVVAAVMTVAAAAALLAAEGVARSRRRAGA
jgi:phosphatidylglycerol:prolipoprotein diacylglycerol transferase